MCLQVKKIKTLKTTDHRRTYNLVSKNLYARCPLCKWHPVFQKDCSDYRFMAMWYMDDGADKPERPKYRDHPNWKLVSKNRKQWMKKRFLTKESRLFDGTIYIRFGW